jgi:hypothetical protein
MAMLAQAIGEGHDDVRGRHLRRRHQESDAWHLRQALGVGDRRKSEADDENDGKPDPPHGKRA